MACLIYYIDKLFSWLLVVIESINKLFAPELLSEQIKYKFYSNNRKEGEGA